MLPYPQIKLAKAKMAMSLERTHAEVFCQGAGLLVHGHSGFHGWRRLMRMDVTEESQRIRLPAPFPGGMRQVESTPPNGRGVIALVKLSPFGEGEVVPHEKTYKGPIEDRLKLMQHTGVQLSPIFGLLAEYSWDGRDEDRAPPAALEDDLFFGLRLGFNDRRDSMLLAGATIDRDTRSTYGQLEISTRLSDRLRLEVEARLFWNVSPDDALRAVERDGFVTTRLSWYF